MKSSITSNGARPSTAIQAVAYDNLKDKYIHETVTHVDHYARGQVHTNCLENFWALLKRTLSCSYVSVDAAHLNAYVAE